MRHIDADHQCDRQTDKQTDSSAAVSVTVCPFITHSSVISISKLIRYHARGER